MAVLTFSVCASMIPRSRSIDSIVTESRRPSFMALATWLRLRDGKQLIVRLAQRVDFLHAELWFAREARPDRVNDPPTL